MKRTVYIDTDCITCMVCVLNGMSFSFIYKSFHIEQMNVRVLFLNQITFWLPLNRKYSLFTISDK